jgi:hypothetical protein
MDEPPQEPAATRASSRSWLWIALAIATTLAVVFGLLWSRSLETTPEEVDEYLTSAAVDVEEVTTEVVDLLINYDSETLEERSESILPLATGSFREEYERLVGEGLGEALAEAEASSEGEIVDGPDVTFASSTQAESLVTTRQTTSSQQRPEGITFIYVMRITLVDEDGDWKADDVEILSRQTAAG